MTTRALAQVDLFGGFIPVFRRRIRRDRPAPDVSPDEVRSRREFVTEMLSRHRGGMSGELDVQCVMMFHGARF